MHEVMKRVFYCDHCKRHRLTKISIEKHEAKCVRNPDRRCGWHGSLPPAVNSGALAKKISEGNLTLDEIRDEAHGCPVCILAGIVQSTLTSQDKWELGFNYSEEIKAFRKAEREMERDYIF